MTFFPDMLFGWLYVGTFLIGLAIASWIDWHSYQVPKWLTVSLLSVVSLLNLVRGGWLADQGHSVWLFDGGSIALGVVDALLFSLTGFLFGFGLFFIMWILGVCGGGDVKLFAAVGAWLGPKMSFWLLATSVIFVFCIVIGRILRNILSKTWFARTPPGGTATPYATTPTPPPTAAKKPRFLGFSLPLFLAALIVVPFTYSRDLQFQILIFVENKPLEGQQP